MIKEKSPEFETAPVIAIRLRQLGDVLSTLDALRALKEARPDRSVVFVVDECYHGLIGGEPYVDSLLGAPPAASGPKGWLAYIRYAAALRRLGASVVLDFHSNARSALLSLLSGAKKRVGFDVKGRKIAYTVVVPRASIEDGRVVRMNSAQSALSLARHAGTGERRDAALVELAIDARVRERGRELLAGTGVSPDSIAAGRVVGLNPGRPYPAKAWPEANFVELAKELGSLGKQPVVLWGPGEEEAAGRIQKKAGCVVAPRVSLSELPGFVQHFGVIVTIDSGLKHVAVCARVPTVTIFGPTSPREWHMGTRLDRYVWRGFSCSPCRRPDCPFGAPCMSTITPRDVLEKIDSIERDSASGDRGQ